MITQILLVGPTDGPTPHEVRWGLRPFCVDIGGRTFYQDHPNADGIWVFRTRQQKVDPPTRYATLERTNHARLTHPIPDVLPDELDVDGVRYRLASVQGDDTRPLYREVS